MVGNNLLEQNLLSDDLVTFFIHLEVDQMLDHEIVDIWKEAGVEEYSRQKMFSNMATGKVAVFRNMPVLIKWSTRPGHQRSWKRK